MSTYYEIINVVPTATQPEIEQALDAQYNRCRRLVTHHDPNVVNQANQALQALEKIRSVLTDTGKRSAYDAAIGSVVSGLEDPNARPAVPQNLPVPPSMPLSHPQPVLHHLPPTQSSNQRSWTCPKCQSQNIVNSQFCKVCGETLAITCPICNKLVEIGAQFCTSCGVSILQAQHKKELEEQLGKYQLDLDRWEKYIPTPEADLGNMKKQIFYAGAWSVVGITAAIAYLFALPGHFPGVDLSSLFLAGSDNSYNLTHGSSGILVAAIMAAILAAVIIFLSLAKKISLFRGIGAALALLLFLGFPRTIQSILVSLHTEGFVITNFDRLATAFVYFILLCIILGIPKRNFKNLKPFNNRLPNLGILGTFFGLLLFAVPLLYCAYLIFSTNGLTDYFFLVNRYEFDIWLVNAIQLFILGFILAGYVVIGWNTSQGIESRYAQAVLLRETNIGKLNQQIKSLAYAISSINLHPQ